MLSGIPGADVSEREVGQLPRALMSRNPAERRAPLAVQLWYRLAYLQSFGLGACLGWGIGQYLSGLSREPGKSMGATRHRRCRNPQSHRSPVRTVRHHSIRCGARIGRASPRSPSAGSLSAPREQNALGWPGRGETCGHNHRGSWTTTFGASSSQATAADERE